MIKSVGSGARLPGYESQPSHFLVGWVAIEIYLISLCLCFLSEKKWG